MPAPTQAPIKDRESKRGRSFPEMMVLDTHCNEVIQPVSALEVHVVAIVTKQTEWSNVVYV